MGQHPQVTETPGPTVC